MMAVTESLDDFVIKPEQSFATIKLTMVHNFLYWIKV